MISGRFIAPTSYIFFLEVMPSISVYIIHAVSSTMIAMESSSSKNGIQHESPWTLASQTFCTTLQARSNLGQVRPWPYHIYGELELVNMQKWVWLLSLHSMAVPLPNCLLQSCIGGFTDFLHRFTDFLHHVGGFTDFFCTTLVASQTFCTTLVASQTFCTTLVASQTFCTTLVASQTSCTASQTFCTMLVASQTFCTTY